MMTVTCKLCGFEVKGEKVLEVISASDVHMMTHDEMPTKDGEEN